jgi:hypothetical protein
VRLQSLDEARAVGVAVDRKTRGDRHALRADDALFNARTARQQEVLEVILDAFKATMWGSSGALQAHVGERCCRDTAGRRQLHLQFGKRRNIRVALDHR